VIYVKLAILSSAQPFKGWLYAVFGVKHADNTRIHAANQIKYCGGVLELPDIRLIVLCFFLKT
jgi:hypothetical protein